MLDSYEGLYMQELIIQPMELKILGIFLLIGIAYVVVSMMNIKTPRAVIKLLKFVGVIGIAFFVKRMLA